ncbi:MULTISPECIES: hypothetical protein [unclassified Clostridium]|uniref:hypothetical protein n=1 Tax=unclassified Clostridium TaxID=2614128 RepID=UPI00189B7CE9|nr:MULTISPECIES: hypothetical protein [unclassified Clostridium]MCR1951780.1 hypothetical protein [Clostridium sp. DSM 100503]
MKKIFSYIITIILGASIPIYYLLVWNPLKSEDVISNNSKEVTTEKKLHSDETLNEQDISKEEKQKKVDNNLKRFNIKEESNNNINSNENIIESDSKIEGLTIKESDIENNLFAELEKSEKLEVDRMLKSLSIIDIVKLNDHFSNKYDNDNVKEGILLVKKRMSLLDYEEFMEIISRYIDLNIIEDEV